MVNPRNKAGNTEELPADCSPCMSYELRNILESYHSYAKVMLVFDGASIQNKENFAHSEGKKEEALLLVMYPPGGRSPDFRAGVAAGVAGVAGTVVLGRWSSRGVICSIM